MLYGDAMELEDILKTVVVPEVVEECVAPCSNDNNDKSGSETDDNEIEMDNKSSSEKDKSSSDDENTMDPFDDLQPFFDEKEFQTMGSYEKLSYRSKKENYERMCKDFGKENVLLPDFMNEKKKKSCSNKEKQKEKPKTGSSKKPAKNLEPSRSSTSSNSSAGPGKNLGRSKRVSVSTSSDHPKKKKSKKCLPAQSCYGPQDMEEEEIVSHLPSYDIDKILVDGKSKLKDVRKLLAENGIVFDNHRKLMIRTLTNYLFFESVESPNDINGMHKEGLAASIVQKYTFFGDSSDCNKYSWFRLFDRSTNSGFIANATQSIYRHMEPEERRQYTRTKSKKESRVSEEVEDDPNYDPKQHKYLALMLPVPTNKSEILLGMDTSFAARQGWIKRTAPSVTEIVRHFPQLLAFEGQVLEEEFNRIHPNSGSLFIKDFPIIIEKLKLLTNSLEHVEGINSEEIQACFTVAKLLPRPNLMRKKDPSASVMPRLDALLLPLPRGKDPKKTADEVRESTKANVQPFLLASIDKKKIFRMWVVCDSELIQINSSSVLKGLDVLFKSYTVFNVEYPIAWKPMFEFLERCVYNIKIAKPTNSMAELKKKLDRVQLNSN